MNEKDNLLKANDLHLAYRHLAEKENTLANLFQADIQFIAKESDVLINTARYLLSDQVSKDILDSNAFSNWFFQEDVSIYQFLEDVEE